MYEKINHKIISFIKRILSAIIYPINKPDTYITFFFTQIIDLIPIIGNILSFVLRMVYSIVLYRRKSKMILPEAYSKTLCNWNFKFLIYIPTLGLNLVVALLLICHVYTPLMIKITVITEHIIDIVFVIFGFGFFVNYTMKEIINLKISINISGKYFFQIILYFLPFIIYSGITLYYVIPMDAAILPNLIWNNIAWIIGYNFVKYYLFLIAIISLADAYHCDENKPSF